MNWLLDWLPWWVPLAFGIAAVVAVFVVLRSLGFSLKATLAAMGTLGLTILASTIYQKGRNEGYEAAKQRQRKADEKAVAERDEVEAKVAARTPEENRERLGKWAVKD